jgi:hypothetical protein
VVQDEDPARPVALDVAERADVDAVGSAVHGVRPAVAGALEHLLGLDRLDQPRSMRVVLGVEDVDPRGAQARDDQVAPLEVRMRGVGTQRGAAHVPAEVVQLVAGLGHVEGVDDLSVRGRVGVEVDGRQPVGPGVAVGVEQGDVGVPFTGRGHRHARGRIEGGIRLEEHRRITFRSIV